MDAEDAILVALRDNVAYVVLQWHQGGQELHDMLLIDQVRDVQAHHKWRINVDASHADVILVFVGFVSAAPLPSSLWITIDLAFIAVLWG